MNEPSQPGVIHASFPVMLPTELVLYVRTNAAGQPEADNAVFRQQVLEYRDLESAGVRVTWQDHDGNDVPRETVLALIEAQRERASQQQVYGLAANDPS